MSDNPQTPRRASRWEGYTPDRWATGGEPMTPRQLRKLWVLHKTLNVDIPFIYLPNGNGQRVTKAEASILITKVERGEPITRAFLESLGRGPEYTSPDHPSTWYRCHEPMTVMQFTLIEELAEQLHVPLASVQKGTLGLTRGQASRLIPILKAELCIRDARWFDKMVTRVMEEVPLPDEVDDDNYQPSEDDSEESEDESDEDCVDVIFFVVRKALKDDAMDWDSDDNSDITDDIGNDSDWTEDMSNEEQDSEDDEQPEDDESVGMEESDRDAEGEVEEDSDEEQGENSDGDEESEEDSEEGVDVGTDVEMEDM